MQSLSLLLTAPRQLEWVTENLPSLQSNEVLVQTSAVDLISTFERLASGTIAPVKVLVRYDAHLET